jgi:hypothetical protein
MPGRLPLPTRTTALGRRPTSRRSGGRSSSSPVTERNCSRHTRITRTRTLTLATKRSCLCLAAAAEHDLDSALEHWQEEPHQQPRL